MNYVSFFTLISMITIATELQNALDGKMIVSRAISLRKCLNTVGVLDPPSLRLWIQLFDTYYAPGDGETKHSLESIQNVYIQYISHLGTYCFQMELNDGTKSFVSYKRLAGASGGKRTYTTNLTRALRHSVHEQIIQFKERNPLDPNMMCPILGIPLGSDAEVDHEIPFAKLKETWLKLHPALKEVCEQSQSAYVLKDKTLEESWKAFHLENAVLRYVSKAGNRLHR
jgi:hypothetical protein